MTGVKGVSIPSLLTAAYRVNAHSMGSVSMQTYEAC